MATYQEVFSDLKQAERLSSEQEQRMRTQHTETLNRHYIGQAQDIVRKLEPFSEHLKTWRKRDIEEKKKRGVAEARKARLDKAKLLEGHAKTIYEIEQAKKLNKLAEGFEDAKAQDTAYQEIKAEMLQLGKESAYPDADRIAKLSPWEQVGYAQEKLRVFNETFPDKLDHAMQNSEKLIELSGISFSPKEIHGNHGALPMKEAAVQVLSDDIKEAAGINQYSEEMLELSKTNESVQKAIDNNLSKYRQRYNIDSSANTRGKAQLEWKRSEKTGYDLQRLLLITGNTVDKSGNLLGNSGAWSQVESILVSEGITNHNPEHAANILNQPMPDSLAHKLGAKPGTTYAQQWPSKASALRLKIKDGIKKGIDAESDWLESAGTKLTNEFIKEARENPEGLSTARVNQIKREYGKLGLPIPSAVTNYETATMRDEREDKQLIEALMASQNGYISNEQLDSFHPQAALEFREKATKIEKEALKAHDADKKIKAHLDTAFTNMGIKGNEKSPAYVEAMANAKADYAQKYNKYIAMGYSSEQASHHALHAQQVVDPETGEAVPDSMGVLTEIRTNGEGSKYVITGQAIEKELKPGHLRVARIHGAKQEILNDASIVTTKVIGGDYGHRQITTIADNVQKHGRRGLYMDKGALAYYKGIARGRNAREGGWWGLVDAQLKAAGHEGLNPAERPKAMELLTGEDANGNTIPDPRGTKAIDRRVSRAMSYPSQQAALFAINSLEDCQRFGRGGCIWDLPENLPIWRTPPITGFPAPWPQIPRPERRWPGSPPFNPKDDNNPLFYKDGGNI